MGERVDLDLNQEPWEIHHDDSVLGLGSLLNDIGAVHGRIEEQIQQLEAITSRAMQRRRLRIQEDQTTTRPVVQDDVVGGVLIETPVNNESSLNVALDDNARRSSTKRSNSHLIAKALEMEMEVDRKKIENDSGGFFDCNICLEIPKEPILTCCGHMFCWACFYRLPYDQSGVRECPECMGEVSDKSVIPIYGSNDAPCDKSKSADFEFKVPPRPRPRRVETVRQQSWVTGSEQQMVNRGFTTFHIQEALRRVVSNRVEVAGVQTPPQEVEDHQVHLPVNSFVNSDAAGASQVPSSEEDNSQHLRILRYSRLLSAEAASLSSLSTTLTSALNSVESMVDDLETIIHSHPISGNVSQENPPINNSSNSTPGNHTLEPIPSSTSTPDFSPSSVHISGEQISNAAGSQMNPTAPSSYPSPRVTEWIPRTSGVATRSSRRRRNSDVNYLDVENGLARAPRRRRFR